MADLDKIAKMHAENDRLEREYRHAAYSRIFQEIYNDTSWHKWYLKMRETEKENPTPVPPEWGEVSP